MVGTSLAPLGPPLVKTKIKSNTFNEPIKEKVALTLSIGRIMGIVMDSAVREGDAMAAAISGLYRHPIGLHFSLEDKEPDFGLLSDQLNSQVNEEPINDASGSSEYRLFMLRGALSNAMTKLGWC